MSSTDAPGPASDASSTTPAAANSTLADAGGTPAKEHAGRWRAIGEWTRKDRLELLAYVAAVVFFLYKLAAGAFSTAVSVLPTCRVVGTAQAPRIAATVEIRADDALKARVIALEAPVFVLASDSPTKSCRFQKLDRERFRELEFKDGGFKEVKGDVASLTPGETASFDCVSEPLPAASATPMLYTVDVRVAMKRSGIMSVLREVKERRGTCVVAIDSTVFGSR